MINNNSKVNASILTALANSHSEDSRLSYLENNPFMSNLVRGLVEEGELDPDILERIQSRQQVIQEEQDVNSSKQDINSLEQIQNPIPENSLKPLPTGNTSKEREVIQSISNLGVSLEDQEYLIRLAKRESNFRPNISNRFGYFGLYQFGTSALKSLGKTKDDLKSSLETQHKAALELAKRNENTLKDILDKYEGKIYKGVKITKNGVRAMAHLLGAGSVKDFFNNTQNTPFAKKGFVDGNGTHITEYARMFA